MLKPKEQKLIETVGGERKKKGGGERERDIG